MPSENLEEQGLEKNPNFELSQIKFLLTQADLHTDGEKRALEEKLYKAIVAESKLTSFTINALSLFLSNPKKIIISILYYVLILYLISSTQTFYRSVRLRTRNLTEIIRQLRILGNTPYPLRIFSVTIFHYMSRLSRAPPRLFFFYTQLHLQ